MIVAKLLMAMCKMCSSFYHTTLC